jgi:hypothetical protein
MRRQEGGPGAVDEEHAHVAVAALGDAAHAAAESRRVLPGA